MNKKWIPSTHLIWFLGLKVKWARLLSCLMHDIDTIAQLISWSRQRSCIHNTLFCWIIESLSLARISMCVYGISTWSSNKSSSILIIAISHSTSWRERSTAASCTGCIGQICIYVEDMIYKRDDFLFDIMFVEREWLNLRCN